MEQAKQIIVDDASPLFARNGKFYKEFASDFRQIRYYTLLIVQKAPPEIREINLLEQQISELIKNAIKHGNRLDADKKVRVWFSFTTEYAWLIVEDEGEGFQRLDEWNEFHRRRTECFLSRNFEDMDRYVSFRTEDSDENDGGNALFAAVEYWTEGVVFNSRRNRVAVKKVFPQKRRAIELE